MPSASGKATNTNTAETRILAPILLNHVLTTTLVTFQTTTDLISLEGTSKV